ncbi:MAG TPA: prenyltransferase/squalene oxidase repeat-containing protein [Planctomycetota bacterium]|nr:prenyltransferase/squalene oxidase repeat-containing protein [Planctomycetota bacterium]
MAKERPAWILGIAAALVLPAFPQDSESGGRRHDDPEVRKAVQKGLEYIATRQQSNGAWRARIMAKGIDPLGTQDDHVATTALAALAMMSDGSYPDRGRFAEHVSKALDWILNCQTDSGYITANGSRMYEHGFATLFLAEVMGMTQKRRKEVEEALRKSVRLYENCQSPDGGWRYQPAPIASDMSLTVVALQALRAARNRGIAVKKEVIERGMKYVASCENRGGGWHYQPGNRVTFNLTGAGIVSRYSIGITEQEIQDLEKHFRYLRSTYNGSIRRGMMSNHFFYGNLYAVQAFYQRGGEHWKWYWDRITRDLLANQYDDGHWEDDVHPNFATAAACVILQVPREYLPIMQK